MQVGSECEGVAKASGQIWGTCAEAGKVAPTPGAERRHSLEVLTLVNKHVHERGSQGKVA